MRRVCADLLERTPRLQALTPPRTKEVLHWCRLRGYTPPDPEPQRTEEDSIEDILTQIDSEPGECVVYVTTHMLVSSRVCVCFEPVVEVNSSCPLFLSAIQSFDLHKTWHRQCSSVLCLSVMVH